MRMDRRRTEIAGRNVPVESGEIITIDFSGGPQPGDAGPKDFWVIFNERAAYIARWRHGEDPGELWWLVLRLASGQRQGKKS